MLGGWKIVQVQPTPAVAKRRAAEESQSPRKVSRQENPQALQVPLQIVCRSVGYNILSNLNNNNCAVTVRAGVKAISSADTLPILREAANLITSQLCWLERIEDLSAEEMAYSTTNSVAILLLILLLMLLPILQL